MSRWKKMYEYRGKPMSPQAQIFIRDRIETLMNTGKYTHKQSIAIAYNEARKKGYKVPKYPLKKWKV